MTQNNLRVACQRLAERHSGSVEGRACAPRRNRLSECFADPNKKRLSHRRVRLGTMSRARVCERNQHLGEQGRQGQTSSHVARIANRDGGDGDRPARLGEDGRGVSCGCIRLHLTRSAFAVAVARSRRPWTPLRRRATARLRSIARSHNSAIRGEIDVQFVADAKRFYLVALLPQPDVRDVVAGIVSELHGFTLLKNSAPGP